MRLRNIFEQLVAYKYAWHRSEDFHLSQRGLLMNKFVDSGSKVTYPARREERSIPGYATDEQRSRTGWIDVQNVKLFLSEPEAKKEDVSW